MANGPLSCAADMAEVAADAGPRIRFALQSLQVGPHVCGVLVAQFAIFFQSLVDDVFQFWRKVGVQPDRGNWITARIS